MWFTQWHPDPFLIFGCLAAIVVYLRWVYRLHKRGDSWLIGRTICWVIAWVLLLRLVFLLATMAFHAFFGISIISMNSLLAAGHFGRLGLHWWVDALVDQKIGGEITWGIGELPTLGLAIILVVLWSRADTKEAKRSDRRAERDEDAELEAYNAMLARLAERDAEQR